jgi:hypothetical protein
VVVIVIVIVIAMVTMLDYHNLLVMSVHVAVVVAVTILLDDDGIFSFRRRGKWHCNSESRECRESDGKLAH